MAVVLKQGQEVQRLPAVLYMRNRRETKCMAIVRKQSSRDHYRIISRPGSSAYHEKI